MKKILSLLLVFSIGLFSIGSISAQEELNSVPNPITDPGGSTRGAIIESVYGNSQWSSQVEDYYMSVPEAREFARKLDVSSGEALFWLGSSFIPHWNYTFGLIGGLSTVYRASIASEIRSYTDNNKKVRVTVMKENQGSYRPNYYIVREWNGDFNSIRAWPEAPNRSYLREIKRTYKTN